MTWSTSLHHYLPHGGDHPHFCLKFNLDQAAENGNSDVGEGQGGEDEGERSYIEQEGSCTSDVWFVHAGPSGTYRSLHTTMKLHVSNTPHKTSMWGI